MSVPDGLKIEMLYRDRCVRKLSLPNQEEFPVEREVLPGADVGRSSWPCLLPGRPATAAGFNRLWWP